MPYLPPNALTMLGLPQGMQPPMQGQQPQPGTQQQPGGGGAGMIDPRILQGGASAPANLQIGGGGVALPPQFGGGQPQGGPPPGGGFSQVGGMGTTAQNPQADAFRQALQGALQQQQGAGAAAQGMSNQIGAPKQAVQGIYQDLFGRQPDPAGMSYWLNQLRGGMPMSNVAQAIANGAQGADITAMQNNPQGRDEALNKWIGAGDAAPNYTNLIKPIDMSQWQGRINSWAQANSQQSEAAVKAKLAAGQPLDVFERQLLVENPGWATPAPAQPAAAPASMAAPAAQGGLLSSGDPSMDEWRRQQSNILPTTWG